MSDINNLIKLENFDIENIQEVIKERYKQGIIYTNCGRILISLNPFKTLPIYGEKYLNKFHNHLEYDNVSPHVYHFAENAYQCMLEEGTNQSILISGESGSGKTEISKHVIRKILYKRNEENSTLEWKINETTDILEAFGNATTILNSNSSRFGKLTEIYYDKQGKVKRAYINEYMLEKSRLIDRNKDEKNFHIFYAFLEGADITKYKLSKDRHCKIVQPFENQYLHITYKEITQALKNFHFSDEDIRKVETSLAVILHITSINFKEDADDHVDIIGKTSVHCVAELMGLDLEEFGKALLERILKMPDGIVTTRKSKMQAEEERDAFAKSLYARLFSWIIAKINSSLSNNQTYENLPSISILDISGFECLKINSFEQLIINFTNEKLQSFLENHVFKAEIQLYEDEEIEVPFNNNYTTNTDVLRMFEEPASLLSITDDQTYFPESTKETLLTNLNEFCRDYECYEIMKDNRKFAVIHFAGKVIYEIDSFLSKNRDEVCVDLMNCAKGSSDIFFSRLFKALRDITGSITSKANSIIEHRNEVEQRKAQEHQIKPKHLEKNRSKTVISYMKNSLSLLIKKIEASEIHFIRCILPNNLKMNKCFVEKLVKWQLLYTGIAHAAKICKSGYPYRKTYREFIEKYCVYSNYCQPTAIQRNAEEILEMANIRPPECRLGKNMIFLKDFSYHNLRKEQKVHLMTAQSHAAITNFDNIDTELSLHENMETIQQEEMKLPPKAKNSETKEMLSPWSNMERIEEESPQEHLNDTFPQQGILRNRYPHQQTEFISSTRNKIHHLQTESTSSGRRRTLDEVDDKLGLKTAENTEESSHNSWDVFEMFEEDPERKELQHTYFAVIVKVCFYFIFFAVVLGSSVIQKLALYDAVLHYENEVKTERSAWLSILSIVICIPHGIGLLFSIHRFAFNNKEKMMFSCGMIMTVIQEMIHSAGVSVVTFHIIPKLEITNFILIMNAIGIVPGIFNLIFTRSNMEGIWYKTLSKFKDTVTLIILLGAFICLLYFSPKMTIFDKIVTFFSIFAVSINSWVNFYDGCRFSTTLDKKISGYIDESYNTKGFVNIIIYILKILMTFLIGYLLTRRDYDIEFQKIDDSRTILPTSQQELAILLTVFTAIGYYISYIACSLCMQKISYALPLMLSTPVAFLTSFFVKNHPPYNLEKNTIIVMICGFMIYLTFYVLTYYIWKPNSFRLQRHEILFQRPSYCSIFYEQTTVLNRKRRDIPITKDTNTSGKDSFCGETIYPTVYMCATMWHETENEMMQLLKSLFRMAIEHILLTDIKNNTGNDDEYYEIEGHIFFDDAMTTDKDGNIVVNKYVENFISLVDKAASAVLKNPVTLEPPCKIETPYGGQLLWQLQEQVLLFVHLKNKKMIRHKKRWSQVMYMYYLLGNRLPGRVQAMMHSSVSDIDEDLYNEGYQKLAKNIFILALDGDVDFQPNAVEKLLDLMKNDPKLGAACGRIHPVGTGPLIWFQIFEYALGHWLQKATEHVMGCVLCSPGCFSLFRGSVLTDMNVMRKYTILPTKAQHYLQYDQGEDRWLCTLILQQGHKIGYSAASDAYTFAPETLKEFFNQRRRWMPSTMVNILDLLGSYKLTIQKNDNVSVWFMVYQLILMILTIIGPATVMMMVSVALDTVFDLGIPMSYLVVIIPNILYVIACFNFKAEMQLKLAGLQSALYSIIMLAVMVGVIIQAVNTSIFNPGVIIILVMSALTTFCGILHLQEFYCLVSGIMYFLAIPAAYLVLVIYSMCNMHVVSWGTREVKQTNVQDPQPVKSNSNDNSFLSKFKEMFHLPDLVAIIKQAFHVNNSEDKTLALLTEINENIKHLLIQHSNKINEPDDGVVTKHALGKSKVSFAENDISIKAKAKRQIKIPTQSWINQPSVGYGSVARLSDAENKFWQELIDKYLYPIKLSVEEEDKIKEVLLDFRTNNFLAFGFINLLWMVLNFMFQYKKPFIFHIKDVKVEIFSFLFLTLFGVIFAIQFIGMCLHRTETCYHIISSTNIFTKGHDVQPTIPPTMKREIFRKLRYQANDDIVMSNNNTSQFHRDAAHYIQNISSKSTMMPLGETLKKRNIATITKQGKTSENRNILAMSKRNMSRKRSLKPFIRDNEFSKETRF